MDPHGWGTSPPRVRMRPDLPHPIFWQPVLYPQLLLGEGCSVGLLMS